MNETDTTEASTSPVEAFEQPPPGWIEYGGCYIQLAQIAYLSHVQVRDHDDLCLDPAGKILPADPIPTAEFLLAFFGQHSLTWRRTAGEYCFDEAGAIAWRDAAPAVRAAATVAARENIEQLRASLWKKIKTELWARQLTKP